MSSSDQSSPPPSPNTFQVVPVLSASEAARRELQAILRGPSPGNEDSDGNSEQVGGAFGDGQVDPDSQVGTWGEQENIPAATSSRPPVLSLHNELAHAKHRAVHYKLAPYQKELTTDFVKA